MSTVSYKEAMQQLQSMFPDFDRETLKTVLVANDGHFEKTIEDCLKMASDNEAGHGGHNDNLFSNAGGHRGGNQPKKMYDASEDLFGDENEPQAENAFENLGMFKNNNANNQQAIDDDDDDFGDNEYKSQQMARKIQESEDAKLAYALQQEYLRREQEAQRQARYSQPTNYTVAHFDGMYRGNPTVNYRPEEQKYNQNVPMSNNTAALPGEKKKRRDLALRLRVLSVVYLARKVRRRTLQLTILESMLKYQPQKRNITHIVILMTKERPSSLIN